MLSTMRQMLMSLCTVRKMVGLNFYLPAFVVYCI